MRADFDQTTSTTQQPMKAFILLLLHCAAFLTNVEFGGARKSRILYYVRGLGGGYPFSYGVGLGSSIGLSPSTTIPLPAAYADGVENLRVSTLSHGQNAGLVKTLTSTVTNSGAGKLDDASAPSVAFSSSTNRSVGLIENPFHLRVGILHKKVLSGGTKSTQTKSSGRNAPSVSTITSLGSIKSPDESPGGVGSRSFVHEKLPASSLTVHLLKSLTSNTGSDQAPLSSRSSSLSIKTTPSKEVENHHKVTVKTQREATVNGDLPAPQVGPTSISALAHTGPTDSSGPGRTVPALSGHDSFNRESGNEGAISTRSISTPSGLPSRHDSSASGNKSSGSAPGNTVSPSAGRSGIPSLPPIHSGEATLPSHAGALIFSKSEPARNLPLDMTETLSRIKDHNTSASNRNTKSGLSLGTLESAAGLSPSVSLPFRDLPGKVNDSGLVSTVVSRQSSSKSVPGLSKKVYVENSAKRFGKNSSDNINVHLKQQHSVIPGMTGSALGAIHTVALVKNEQEKHNILETALKKTSGASDDIASGDLHGSSGSNYIHKSKPLVVAVNSVIPPKRGSPFRYSSAPLGYKVAPAITKTEGALSENAPSVGKPISGIVQDVIRKTPENNREAGSSGHKNFPYSWNTKSSVPLLAVGGSAKPNSGILGTLEFTGQNGLGQPPIQNAAVKVTNGVPNATNKQQISSNGAYGLFADTSLPSGFSISSTGVPTGLRSNMFHSSKRLGYNTVGAARVPSTNAERFLSNEFHAHVGRFLDGTPRPPALNSRANGPHAFGIHPSGLSSGKSQSSTAIRTPEPLVHVQAFPSNGSTGSADMLRNIPSLSNPPGISQNRGDYGSFIHTDLPSGFSTSSTGAPTRAGMLIYHASTSKEVPPPTGIIGATTTTDHPIHPNDVREHEGLPGSSSKMDAQDDQRYPTHDREIERLGSDTSELSVTPTASHPLGHNQVSSAYGHTGAVARENKMPDLMNPSLPHHRTAAYSFSPYKSLPSSILISRVRTPAGVGSNILRASKYFQGPSNSGMVITAGAHDQPSRTAEVLNDAGRSTRSMVRTQMQYRGSTVRPVPGMKPLGSTNDISKSNALNKDSDIAITDQSYPITHKIGAEYTLLKIPGVINATPYPNRHEAYGHLSFANRPPNFSTSATGVPMESGDNTLPSAKLLEVSAKSGSIGVTSIPRQSSVSQVAGERMRGFPAIRTKAQFPNSRQYHAQFHGREIPGYGSGIIESLVPSSVSQPSLHVRASTSGNAVAPRPLMNAPSFINPPSPARITVAQRSFTHVTSPLGFQISRTEGPIGVGFGRQRPSEHLGGSSRSGITAATVAPAMPSIYSEARDFKAFSASSGRANFGVHGQYPSPTFRHQMPDFASGMSRLSLPLKMSHSFGRMQPSLSTETTGSVHLQQNVPGLSNQPQFSQRHGSYDSLVYSSPPPGLSITNSRTSAGARSRIFRSTERLQGYTTPGITNAGSADQPIHRSELHQDLRGIRTSNTNQPVATHQVQSQELGEHTYGFSGITKPFTNLNDNPNSGNVGVLGSVRELDGAKKASQQTALSAGGERSTRGGGYSILPESASLTNFASMSLANDEKHFGFQPPRTMRSFVQTEIPQTTRMWPPPPSLAETRNLGGPSHTNSYRTKPQQARFGSLATYNSRYPGVLDSRFTIDPTTQPVVAVPKVTDSSKHVGGLAGSSFTVTAVNEQPTNPTYAPTFNGNFNAERRTTEREISSSYKYLPSSITSSSNTPKVNSYEPGSYLDFQNLETGSRPHRFFSNQRVPVFQHFTAKGWKTTSGESSGDHALTVRSPTATRIGDVGSTIRQGDAAYKPDYSGHSEIVGARRHFLNQLRFEKDTKPTRHSFAARGVVQSGSSGGYNLPVPETRPSSFQTGFTGPAHEAGFKTYNVVRNSRDNADYEMNSALKDLRRQSTMTTTSEYETGHHSISSGQPNPTNEYRFIPYSIRSRKRVLSTRSRSDKVFTLSGDSNHLEGDTGSPSIEAGGGWPAGFGEAPIASRGFTVDSTRHTVLDAGTSRSASEGRGWSVGIGGSEDSPNTDTTMNSNLNGHLIDSMSRYPSKYKYSGGPLAPYFRKHDSATQFSSTYGFDVGHNGGRGKSDNSRFPVTTGYRAIPASLASNPGYHTKNPLYRSYGSRGYLSQSTSRRDFSVYSGTYDNRGHKSYQPYFVPRSASESSISSQDNGAWNPRGA